MRTSKVDCHILRSKIDADFPLPDTSKRIRLQQTQSSRLFQELYETITSCAYSVQRYNGFVDSVHRYYKSYIARNSVRKLLFPVEDGLGMHNAVSQTSAEIMRHDEKRRIIGCPRFKDANCDSS